MQEGKTFTPKKTKLEVERKIRNGGYLRKKAGMRI